MVPDPSRRSTLRAAGSTLAVALAGCSGLLGDSGPQVASSFGGTDYDAVVRGQPTIDDGVPAVWGVIFAHPDPARKLVDWSALVSAASDVEPGTEFRTFDPTEQFVTVVVGVLPTGYGLTGYDDGNDSVIEDVLEDFSNRPAVVDGRLRYDVTPFRSFSPDDGVPEHHYDYTFTLWNLNGGDRPDEIVVDYHAP